MVSLTDAGRKGGSGCKPRLALRLSGGGFTMVELIVVILLLGIISVVAIPRMVAWNFYNTAGFADRVMAGMRYAQKQAIAKRRNVCVSINGTGTSIAFTYASAAGSAAACDTNLTGPAGQNPYTVTPERAGATVAPASLGIGFSALGRPFNATTLVPLAAVQVITINGDTGTTFSVEPESGYVHT